MIWVTLLIYHLIVCEYVLRAVRVSWRFKRSNYPCPRGCTSCSRVNGCITCEGRLFMVLYRHNMRETGRCAASCPDGYYGVRHPYYNMCYRCQIEHCQSCFDQNVCTTCQSPYVALDGHCQENCPVGLHYANYTRECKDRVDCLVGGWSPWSACAASDGETCGNRWGERSRTRPLLQTASVGGTPCPQVTSTQRCRLRQSQCTGA